ncbi:glyoxylate/hydroxypyruvate reductase A [uncultured Pontibacter sp.]|uniref:2-hydroxyacid dehydrogenase n=1 Tax=uncultured Pontibacter sp. TaxID=453356 RepID=UPI0026311A4B|nr:glyoxylate/hydroxypyruvate reductase A [uncultured Pontibacter sp.]
MSILIVNNSRWLNFWLDALKESRPDLKVHVYPYDGPPEEIEFAISWNHPLGAFKQFPNLRCIASTGAGVDHILRDPELPAGVQLTRVVDEDLTNDMATFTTTLVLSHVRGLFSYKVAEATQRWEPKTYQRPKDVKVGVMGVGVLGTETGRQLKALGFNVQGWAKSTKNIESIPVFAGDAGLADFLATSNILICLLPLTKETANILNKTTLSKLPKGAYVINVARGEHLVDADLLEMIDSEHIAGASLDVFRTEPLPEEHPFWAHPKISITPHIASITNPASAVRQILANYDRLKQQKPLLNLVSLTKGY